MAQSTILKWTKGIILQVCISARNHFASWPRAKSSQHSFGYNERQPIPCLAPLNSLHLKDCNPCNNNSCPHNASNQRPSQILLELFLFIKCWSNECFLKEPHKVNEPHEWQSKTANYKIFSAKFQFISIFHSIKVWHLENMLYITGRKLSALQLL